ncbi:hypothetical protein LPJ74_002379 [Coemansia sp. RSA 1843]|nr:hypothetical protein LPJ74_002379 [Coemansia sp. RSA 1843]
MDNPASYTHSTLQQRSASSIQNILAYGVSPSSLPPSPKHLQRQSPQHLAAAAAAASAMPRPSAEAFTSQSASADGQKSTISSEADFGKDDNIHPSGDSSTRRRNINSSKRAAQNRAAQRAFRLRRERYVAGLEEKARSYDRLESAYMEMQRENFQLWSRLNKLQSENSILRTRLAAGTHTSPSPPTGAAVSFMSTQPSTIAPDRAAHQYTLRPPPPTHPQPKPGYQQPHHHHAPYPRYHQRNHDHPSAAYQDNQQPSHGPFRHQSAIDRHPSPAGAQQPYYHHHHRHNSQQQQQQQQQQQAAPLHRHHYPIRREHSLPQHIAAGHRSPVPAESQLMRPEPMPPTAFASPVERMSSPGGAWDGVATADRAPSPPAGTPSYNPPVSSETASSSSSATAAHMLPSVREITMSIGAMLPASPHTGSLPAQSQFYTEGTDSRQESGCSETKRRPW